jgi:hypothetical protein
MRTFCGAILAATAAFQAAAGIDCADVSVADFPRLAGEAGDSARIMRAVEAAGKGGVVWFPRGEYEIDAMLVVSNSASLLLHKSAHLKAVRETPPFRPTSPDTPLVIAFEIPFANARYLTLYPPKFRAFGRDIAAAIKEFLVDCGDKPL